MVKSRLGVVVEDVPIRERTGVFAHFQEMDRALEEGLGRSEIPLDSIRASRGDRAR